MGAVEPAGASFIAIDAAEVFARLVEPVDVALAVAVGDPYIAVAPVALLVDGDEGGGVIPLLVDGQVRLRQSGNDFSVQGGLDNLARVGAGAGWVLVSYLELALTAVVGNPQVLGAALFYKGNAVGVGHGQLPCPEDATGTVQDLDCGVTGMEGDHVPGLGHRHAVMGPPIPGALCAGQLGPILVPLVGVSSLPDAHVSAPFVLY